MAPPDAAWCAMCFLGACVLLPYNCLLTAQPYFDEHAFRDMKFPFTSMLVYSLFLCTSQVLLIFCGEVLSVRTRIVAAFVSCLLACASLLAIALVAHLRSGSTALCAACLAFVAVLAVSNSLLQTALLGLAGAIGPELSGAVMVGLGISGLLSLGVSLLAQALERIAGGVSEATGEAGVIVAAVLFATCIAYALASARLYFSFLSTREPRTASALAALEVQREGRRTLVPASAAGACDGRGTEEGARRGLSVLREVAPQAVNVCAVFAVTMCVFPGVLTQWKPGPGSAFRSSRQLFGTLLIGTFQVFDVLSRLAAGWTSKHIRPTRLWAFVVLRVAFIPLFVLGQRQPQAFALWGSDWGRFLLAAGLAFTNGLLASCAMMFGPVRAAPGRREAAGIAMSCVMVLGIFVGTLLALLTQLGSDGEA